MRTLLLALVLLLAACSGLDSTVRRVPDAVQSDARALVDEVMAGETARVREAFPDAEGEQFEAFIARLGTAPRQGEELARNLVAAQVVRGGGAAGYNLAYEVETPEGFTVVSTRYRVEPGGEPVLVDVFVEGSDSSIAASRRRLGMATRLIALAFGLGIVLVGLLWFRRARAARTK